MTGKLIVLEGCDGVGKATQTKLLFNRLQKEGYIVETVSFPRYETEFGKKIKTQLEKASSELSPYKFGELYANDRLGAKPLLETWLRNNKVILADRYMESNLAYQGAKLSDLDGKKKLWKFFIDLEYRKNKIPEPSVVLYLDLPPEISDKLRPEKRDQNEKSIEYQKLVRGTFLELINRENELKYGINWVKINCHDEKTNWIKEESVIADLIYEAVKPILV